MAGRREHVLGGRFGGLKWSKDALVFSSLSLCSRMSCVHCRWSAGGYWARPDWARMVEDGRARRRQNLGPRSRVPYPRWCTWRWAVATAVEAVPTSRLAPRANRFLAAAAAAAAADRGARLRQRPVAGKKGRRLSPLASIATTSCAACPAASSPLPPQPAQLSPSAAVASSASHRATLDIASETGHHVATR